MILKGQVTISRWTGSDGEGVNIQFRDVKSATDFAEMNMTLEAFARAVTGQGCVEANLEVRGLDNVGTRKENKSVVVQCAHHYGHAGLVEKAHAAVRALEVDGWRARSGDIDNWHNYVPGGITVVFFRNVKDDQ